MIRIVTADDHALFREMLRLVLPRAGEIEVVGEAGDGQELQPVLQRARPDVLLLDYKMPYARDFESFLRSIVAAHPGLRVVMLTGFAHMDVATRAAGAGARGYVLKATRLAGVADAVRAVASGGVWIDPMLPRRIFDAFQRLACPSSDEGSIGGLTRREREVLACVAEGTSNLAIAAKLGISEETVKTHLSRVYAKLGVKNRLAAALHFFGKADPVSR